MEYDNRTEYDARIRGMIVGYEKTKAETAITKAATTTHTDTRRTEGYDVRHMKATCQFNGDRATPSFIIDTCNLVSNQQPEHSQQNIRRLLRITNQARTEARDPAIACAGG